MAPSLVIFDFDGTLADSFAWLSRVLNDVADKYGFKRVAPDEIETLRGLGAREIAAHLGIPAWKMPLIANHMRKRKAQALDQTPLFDGIDRMLRNLAARGVALAVVSSDAERNVRATLGPELAALIAHFECGASLFGKAAKFRTVLRKSGRTPAQAICIGDEIRDLEAAREAGIAFGAVAWGYTRADALAARRPAVLFHNVDQISEMLFDAAPSLHSDTRPRDQ